ncbi:MAG: glutamate--cysteine ligase [Xanthomonadales bacterium]|nr:glutamate--cysteine ligase [Xanthomonadales bacterium]
MNKQSQSTHVYSKTELVEYLESGCKPKTDWKLGTEHEKFGYRLDDLRPLPYEGERGIRAILEALAAQFGWQPVLEDGRIIALVDETGASITLEPGGQLELSGAVLDNIHQTCTEVYTHLKQVRAVSEPLGVAFLGMGFQPKWRREEMEWMPKGRYRIMREYMDKVGTLGVDMMSRTCTIQVNMDFSSEADMVHKFRTALALQPVATALFANSPFTDGRPNGFVSYRSRVWEDTDPDRTGMLPWVFEGEMGFEKYVDYMLDVPMYFVYRNGTYLDASGQSFRDFLDGRLPALPGEKPTLKDWEDHLTTAFPEVRLKRFLEMRGADGGPWRRICALPALWAGLLYHQETLDAAWDLASGWSMEERLRLREEVPRLGLKAEIRGRSVLDIATDVVDLANRGLTARARLNGAGDNETGFLSPLSQVVENRETPAERKLALYHGPWNESVDPIFFECSY